MNPVIPIEKLILFAGILIPLGAWLAWRSAAAASTGIRVLLSMLRVIGFMMLAIVAFNPGKHKILQDENSTTWALLVDNSESMLQADVDGQTRLKTAQKLAEKVLVAADDPALVRTATFSDTLRSVSDEYKTLQPQHGGTDIIGSGRSLLAEYAGTRRLRGMLLISDGRQVATADSDAFVLHAQAQNTPVYAVALGGKILQPDLRVRSMRREYVAFKGQTVRVDINISAEAMGPMIANLEILDSDQKVVVTADVELSDAVADKTVSFEVPDIPPGRHLYSCRVATQDGEYLTWNNSDSFEVVVLEHAVAVLHVEGLPYWDSKFLMQLLRRQPNMNVESIYRVGPERFFKVESDITKSKSITGKIFPDTIDELSQYDMVILGKGCEYVLSSTAVSVLREFVRDHGGSLIFSRGKPYHGSFPDLESLEIGEWGRVVTSELQLRPTVTGEEMGLFGRLLPARDADVWNSLPPIRRANALKSLQSFSRVMAVGKEGRTASALEIPLIVSRRYGKGMILTINADGIWQWGFMPSIKEADKMYNEIWAQLLNWTITYGEFLPGEDLSISIGETTIAVGGSTHIQVRHRPTQSAVQAPSIVLSYNGEPAGDSTLQVHPDDSLRWDGILTFSKAGSYHIKVKDEDGNGPERTVTILAENDERTNESAGANYLEHICRATGGSLIEPGDITDLIRQFEKSEMIPEDVETKWEPLWDNPLYLILLLIPFSLEWFLRRRNGLL